MTAKKRGPKKKVGPKKKFIPDEKILKEIENFGAIRLTQRKIHDYYGIGHETWYKRIEEYPEILEAYRKGIARGQRMLQSKAFEIAMKGNVSMIQFLMKEKGQGGFVDENQDNDESEKSTTKFKLDTTDPILAAKIYQEFIGGKK